MTADDITKTFVREAINLLPAAWCKDGVTRILFEVQGAALAVTLKKFEIYLEGKHQNADSHEGN